MNKYSIIQLSLLQKVQICCRYLPFLLFFFLNKFWLLNIFNYQVFIFHFNKTNVLKRVHRSNPIEQFGQKGRLLKCGPVSFYYLSCKLGFKSNFKNYFILAIIREDKNLWVVAFSKSIMAKHQSLKNKSSKTHVSPACKAGQHIKVWQTDGQTDRQIERQVRGGPMCQPAYVKELDAVHSKSWYAPPHCPPTTWDHISSQSGLTSNFPCGPSFVSTHLFYVPLSLLIKMKPQVHVTNDKIWLNQGP